MTSTIPRTAIVLLTIAIGTICGCSDSASDLEGDFDLERFRQSMRSRPDLADDDENDADDDEDRVLLKELFELNMKKNQAVSELESAQQRRKALEVEIASSEAELARLKKDELATAKQQMMSLATMTRELGELRREIDGSRRDLEGLTAQRREVERQASRPSPAPVPPDVCCPQIQFWCRPQPKACR